MTVSVCLSVCLSVCPRPYLWKYTPYLHQFFSACYLWLWLGPPLAALWYVEYFWFMNDVTCAHNRPYELQGCWWEQAASLIVQWPRQLGLRAMAAAAHRAFYALFMIPVLVMFSQPEWTVKMGMGGVNLTITPNVLEYYAYWEVICKINSCSS